MTTDQQKAIEAYKALQAIGGKIVLPVADLTPKGKRSARVVGTDRGGRQLRWYVSGRIYNWLSVNADNVAMTREWLA